jgi:hypothetical protein
VIKIFVLNRVPEDKMVNTEFPCVYYIQTEAATTAVYRMKDSNYWNTTTVFTSLPTDLVELTSVQVPAPKEAGLPTPGVPNFNSLFNQPLKSITIELQ